LAYNRLAYNHRPERSADPARKDPWHPRPARCSNHHTSRKSDTARSKGMLSDPLAHPKRISN